MEHVVVHMSSSAVPVPANRHHSLMHSPAALVVGNAEMPAGSITHVRPPSFEHVASTMDHVWLLFLFPRVDRMVRNSSCTRKSI